MAENRYLTNLVGRLESTQPGAYGLLCNWNDLPKDVGLKLLGEVLSTGCKAQNVANHVVSRATCNQLPKEWLASVIDEAIAHSLDLGDYWEYMRLLELLEEALPSAVPRYIDRGLASSDPEIVDAAANWKVPSWLARN